MAGPEELVFGDEDEDYDDEYETEDEYDEDAFDEEVLDRSQAQGAGAAGGGTVARSESAIGHDGTEHVAAGQQEDEEEEEEEEEEEAVPSWDGLSQLPEKEHILDLLGQLYDQGRRSLTILLLGKSGVGKSSTVNSLLGEQVASVSAFKLQPDTESSSTYSRQIEIGDPELDGFKIKIIDTCGLEDPESGDTVNYGALQRISEDIRGIPIDVVLYVDRLDMYRLEPLDRRIMHSIRDHFGSALWRKTVLALTHGNLSKPPAGIDFNTFSNSRVHQLQRGVRSLFFRPALPAVLVENSNSCGTDDAGCRLLPNDSIWLLEVMQAAVDMALNGRAYQYQTRLTKQPNKQFRWMIPVLVGLQYWGYQKYVVPEFRYFLEGREEGREEIWQNAAKERQELGIHPPLKHNKQDIWRLEQMYEDD